MHPVPTPAAQPQQLLDLRTVQDRLGCSRSRAYELIASGELKSVSLGRLRKVRETDLVDFINRLGEPAA